MAFGKICFLLTTACFLSLISKNVEAKVAIPVKVTVYYESMCPDSGRFFAEQLQPTFALIPSYMKVELVPYGNARYKYQGGKYIFTCQHGPEECYGNVAQTCYTYFVNDTMSRIKFINCAFNSPTQKKSLDLCIEDPTLKYKVTKCMDTPLGNTLEYEMAKKTEALSPAHSFIPWITLNGKGSREFNLKAIDDLLSAICAEIQGQKPDHCVKNKWNIFKKFRKNYL